MGGLLSSDRRRQFSTRFFFSSKSEEFFALELLVVFRGLFFFGEMNAGNEAGRGGATRDQRSSTTPHYDVTQTGVPVG